MQSYIVRAIFTIFISAMCIACNTIQSEISLQQDWKSLHRDDKLEYIASRAGGFVESGPLNGSLEEKRNLEQAIQKYYETEGWYQTALMVSALNLVAADEWCCRDYFYSKVQEPGSRSKFNKLAKFYKTADFVLGEQRYGFDIRKSSYILKTMEDMVNEMVELRDDPRVCQAFFNEESLGSYVTIVGDRKDLPYEFIRSCELADFRYEKVRAERDKIIAEQKRNQAIKKKKQDSLMDLLYKKKK